MRIIQKNGSILIPVIVAIVTVASFGTWMSSESTISVINQLEFNQANIARNLAYSGIDYAKGMAYKYSKDGKSLDELLEDLEEDEGVISLGSNVGSFKLIAEKDTTTTFTVKSTTGYSPSGSMQAAYTLPLQTTITFPSETPTDPDWEGWPPDQEPPVVYGQNMAIILSNVEGNISSASDLFVGGLVNINGNLCALQDVTVSIGADVSGNVEASGNVDVKYGVNIHGNITAGDDVTLTGIPFIGRVWVGGDVTAGGQIDKNASVTIDGDEREYTSSTISCASIKLPPFREVPESAPSSPEGGIGLSEDNPFLGGEDYFYQSFNFSEASNLYFDLSKGDFAVFVEGDITFKEGTRFHIKETEDGEWRIFNNYPDESFRDAAAALYFESHGSVTIKSTLFSRTYWLGTVYAQGDIDISLLNGAYGQFVSHYEGFTLEGASRITYVAANYWDRLTD